MPLQSQEVIAGGRYMAGADTEAMFAPGNVAENMTLEVVWRTGKRSLVNGVKANRAYEIEEAAAKDFTPSAKPHPQPFFEDISGLIEHVHQENEFNDFERQPGLPRKFSQLGPGVAWADVDGDGWDDLIIGSGKGGRLAIFRNDNHGGFKAIAGGALDQPAPRDQSGIVVWRGDGKPARVLAGSANYEEAKEVPSGVQQFDPLSKSIEVGLTNSESSIGPLALTDMDGDGNLDLFVGGRVIAGRYPEAASSRVYRHLNGAWQLDEENTRVLEKIGLVSGAVWSDLDGDGYPELILACEWGPIRIFQNDHGKLSETNLPLSVASFPTLHAPRSTLHDLTGWWNGVTTGDLDGDGHMDIIASNWGLNTPYRANPETPAILYYGEFGDGGALDLIEAEYDPDRKAIVPRRMREKVAEALPDVHGRFTTHKAFSVANMDEILGSHQAAAHEVRASTLASMVFLNRTNHFDGQLLPAEAQFAPAFSVNVGDFDGYGYEDIFLSQNFFANQPEIPRYDAGRGLLLRGDGTGQFAAVPGQESGIKVYGEQRGAAAADFDQDGRLDLVVTQNGAPTKLFRNVKAKPGLRVRLAGPPGNPDGIGAQMRLFFGERAGPVREIHGGSGYWSQDSTVMLLSVPETPSRIWVRWPGGKVTTTPIPDQVKEISVDRDGKLIPNP
ncbi:MAG: hypothetical protein AUI63_03335 [Gemmatimonadetes bacterium 13_1_40CM_2_60_3]|nr:MAG: hypothetical protein AUI63_03335 [Gemmatimonadetes bacterium 13_1_40CM_2_60_3]